MGANQGGGGGYRFRWWRHPPESAIMVPGNPREPPGSVNILKTKKVVLGDMGTGKTSMVFRFIKGQFYDYQESTIGASFSTEVVSIDKTTVKFDIWDTVTGKVQWVTTVVFGDMGTGKTSMVLRFIKGQFYDYQESTIGASFSTEVASIGKTTVKFDIWDTAGQERYHSLAPMYYRGAAAAVVVYDITKMVSFERTKKWIEELKRHGNPNLVMVLVANKADLNKNREIDIEEGKQYAKDNNMQFFETSAKTAENLHELFYEIAKRVADAQATHDTPSGMKLEISERQDKGRSLFCCS
uniref:Ras-related protein RHN1 isoform X1 n=1 Tax=Tanacetum cinerariifolium TaxID=118510 RepID=A0A6L2MZP5_TANCI|nr:Ras-related protein RHN1 isoform X1 [Tanacetum cinerariifolium]